MIAKLRAAAAIVGLVLVSIALIPVQMVAMRRRARLRRTLPRLWHQAAAALIGLRVETRGTPAAGRPLLLVANHQSWADIVALGSVVEASFVAKSEVRGWPVFGALARLHRTVFVERQSPRKVGRETDALARRMAAGDAMVLFAEGTTSDGNLVLPFRTALFGAAQASLAHSGQGEMFVQPVAVAWTRLHGLPLGRFGRPLAAWPGDVELLPHLSTFLREAAFDVVISFGEPIRFTAGADRKRLASACESAVRSMLAESLCGTTPMPDQPVSQRVLASDDGQADIGGHSVAPSRTR
jgi:lyso-ornithine lipid O-acyltransferase